jgi:DNA-binding LacI/PurR family transcriptional regulator
VMLDALFERLGAAGFTLEFECRPTLFHRHSAAQLARLDALPDTAAWVLFYSTEAMQRWFDGRDRPCLSIGATHAGVKLPSVSDDSEAVARHAAGLFYQRGHRRFVYLTADFTSLGDSLGCRAFVDEATRLGAVVNVVTHGATAAAARCLLERVLAERPRPTAFFSSCPEHCLTALGHFIQAGLRVPADVAIIAGHEDLFLAYAVPTIACYRGDGAVMGRHAATILLDLLKHGPGKARTVRVLPEFVPGETLGPIATAA